MGADTAGRVSVVELSLPTHADSKHDHAEHSYALDSLAQVMMRAYCVLPVHCSFL